MIVSKTPNIKIPVSILAVEATAGFIISTNGLTRNSDISEDHIIWRRCCDEVENHIWQSSGFIKNNN